MNIKSEADFWNRLIIDLRHAFVSKTFNTFDQNITVFKLRTLYFDYFNEIRKVIYLGDEYIFLKHVQNTYLTILPYKTIKAVVDKMSKVFGLDDLGLNEFDFIVEKEEITAKKWRGRNWSRFQTEIRLFYNYESSLLQIQINLK